MATCIKLVTPAAVVNGGFEVDDFQEAAQYLREFAPEQMEIVDEIFVFDCDEHIYAMCAGECGTGFARIIEILREYYVKTLIANADCTEDEAWKEARAISMKGFE